MAIKKKISNAAISSLKIEDKRINDTELPGFHARISPKGKITYFLYYRHNGKQQNVKLGTHPEITPAQSRDAAKAARTEKQKPRTSEKRCAHTSDAAKLGQRKPNKSRSSAAKHTRRSAL